MWHHKLVLFALALTMIPGCAPSATGPASAQAQPNADLVEQVDIAPAKDVKPAETSAGPTQTHAPTAAPANNERPKLKFRFGRYLAEQVDKLEGGSAEERDLIRDTLRKNDDTLDRAFSNLKGRIEAANNTHDGPRRIEIPAP